MRLVALIYKKIKAKQKNLKILKFFKNFLLIGKF